MTRAYDLYAESNPAFCAAVLASFCAAYSGRARQAPSLIVVYPVLPIVMSQDLAETFEGTNRGTGLMVWLHRHPRVLDDLAKRINATLCITTEAVRFGCFSNLLKLDLDGSIAGVLKSLPAQGRDGSVSAIFKHSRLLGYWMAGEGSPRAIMESFGVTV
ncbi:three component ABC system middle component [Burkholderia multivorans]|uniref:three component ABC system middle component n=1 Tax=Burkholderia multivorans TaxID=87883 RepID=UPI001C61587A|nr:three component ABC system middle component [Burkholderia multivorans]